jgi:hypothetical protein
LPSSALRYRFSCFFSALHNDIAANLRAAPLTTGFGPVYLEVWTAPIPAALIILTMAITITIPAAATTADLMEAVEAATTAASMAGEAIISF